MTQHKKTNIAGTVHEYCKILLRIQKSATAKAVIC